MNLLFYMAKKYVFAKSYSSTLAWIRAAALLSISFSIAASWIVLSAFNGIQETVIAAHAAFQSDLKIIPKAKKYLDLSLLNQIQSLDTSLILSYSLEENVLLEYKTYQQMTTLKGISSVFLAQIQEKKISFIGEENEYFIYLGQGLWNNIRYQNDMPLEFWSLTAPITNKKELKQALRNYPLWVNGYFIAPGMYNQQILIQYEMAKKVLGFQDDKITAIEVFIPQKIEIQKIKTKIHHFLADDFIIQDSKEQNAFFNKISESEKWISFFFISFILVMASFSVLVMHILILLEKKQEIQNLYQLGFSWRQISWIFSLTSWILSNIGFLMGLILAYILLITQIHFQYLSFQNGLIDHFPFAIYWTDIFYLLLIFNGISVTLALLPQKYFVKNR